MQKQARLGSPFSPAAHAVKPATFDDASYIVLIFSSHTNTLLKNQIGEVMDFS